MFYAGQLVLCVNDRPSHAIGIPVPQGVKFGGLDGLKKGVVYTVRRTGVHHLDGVPLLWLHEIMRERTADDPEEPGYATVRFRPRKDSALDCFTALLEPAPKETEAV